MNAIEGLQFPFKFEKWITKVAILGVLALTFIGIIPALGWGLRLLRNLITGVESLPEFDDWGGDAVRGLYAIGGGLIYALPIIILSCCGQMLTFIDDNFLFTMVSCCISIVGLVYSVVIMPIQAAATARFAMTDDFNDAYLDFNGRVNDAREHTSEALMLIVDYVVLWLIGGLAISIGFALCCVPGIIALGIASVASLYVISVYAKSIGIGGSGTPAASPTFDPPVASI